MNPRVCVCCGEPISEEGNAFSRNPNMCASCSNLADGIGEADIPESSRTEREQPAATGKPLEVKKAA